MSIMIWIQLFPTLLLLHPALGDVELTISPLGEMSQGEKFILSCLHKSGSYSSDDPFLWRKDETVLPGETKNILKFDALRRSDLGLYDCGYNTTKGVVVYSNKYHLDISYRPVMHISVRAEDRQGSYVPAGYDVFLFCNVTDSNPDVPADNYLWWYSKTCQDKDFSPLEPNKALFKLPRVSFIDAGCYTCMAMNMDRLHNNASKMLHISYLGYPCISVDPALMEGDRTRVNCSVRSSPPASLELYKNGTLLKKVWGEEADNQVSHPIKSISLQDRGLYECRVSNAAIKASRKVSTHLTLLHKPVLLGDNGSHQMEVRAALGAVARLRVEFDANPQPEVLWQRPTQDQDRALLDSAVHSPNSSQLDVQVQDSLMVFHVEISNIYGSLHVQITVHGTSGTDVTSPAAGEDLSSTPAPEEAPGAGSCADLFWPGFGFGVALCIVVILILAAVLYWRICRKPGPRADPQGTPSTEEQRAPLQGEMAMRAM